MFTYSGQRITYGGVLCRRTLALALRRSRHYIGRDNKVRGGITKTGKGWAGAKDEITNFGTR